MNKISNINRKKKEVKFKSEKLQKMWDDSTVILLVIDNKEVLVAKDEYCNRKGVKFPVSKLEVEQLAYSASNCVVTTMWNQYLDSNGEKETCKSLMNVC